MTTLRLPLEVIQGTEFRRRFRAFQDMEKTLVVDFTGFEIEMICRSRQWQQAPIIIAADQANGRIQNAEALGYFDLILEADATAVLEDGDYYYWLTVFPTDHREMTAMWLEGPLKVLPGVV